MVPFILALLQKSNYNTFRVISCVSKTVYPSMKAVVITANAARSNSPSGPDLFDFRTFGHYSIQSDQRDARTVARDRRAHGARIRVP